MTQRKQVVYYCRDPVIWGFPFLRRVMFAGGNSICLCVKGIFCWPPRRTLWSTKYVHIKSTIVYAPRRNWDSPPTPHPQASVPPTPCFWGEGNTRWRERGWESPNSDEGHTLWYSLYVRTLCSGQIVDPTTPVLCEMYPLHYAHLIFNFQGPLISSCYTLWSIFIKVHDK